MNRVLRGVTWLALIVGLVVVLAGCRERIPPAPTPLALAPSPVATLASPTPAASATVPPTPTPAPSLTPTPSPTQTPSPTATPTPHPLREWTIEGLRDRDYPGGAIEVRALVTTTEAYTRYYIAYPSDDLTITGIMHVPHGEGPFPVVILNHGYIPPSQYWSGADTWRAADYLARRGYLTLAPDFRGWGGSDQGPNYFRAGLVVDIANLVSSLPSLPDADPERVGMWGHSMGGGATTKAITVDPRIKAAVLYAPVSADDTVVMRRWGSRSGGGTDDQLESSYRTAIRDNDFLKLTSPINYFEWVVAAVQIHQGTADTTTPPAWAEAIRDSLLAAGKSVEYFEYQDQGHAFQGEHWTLFMQRVAEFFDRHLQESL